jgi:hypothetical protein
MGKNYFDKEQKNENIVKILLSIIVGLLIVNMLAFKSVINIASNKTISIQVPQLVESGEYVIGSSFASNNVYKMWTRIWLDQIANFSYKNIKERTEFLYPFLDPETAFKNKGKLEEFKDFVENNFITQKFELKDILITDFNDGYKQIFAYGTIHRKIGKKDDKLNGIGYVYEFILFVRNGQIYINSLSAKILPKDLSEKKKLNQIDSVYFEKEILLSKKKKEEITKLKNKQKLEKEKEIKRRKKEKEKKELEQTKLLEENNNE